VEYSADIHLIQDKIGLNTAGTYIITMLRCLDNFESNKHVNNFCISVKTSKTQIAVGTVVTKVKIIFDCGSQS